MAGVAAVGPAPLSSADIFAVARAGAPVELTAEAYRAMAATRAHIEALAADERPYYGVSTGFGALATLFIPAPQQAALQLSLIRSPAAGAGPEVEAEVVRPGDGRAAAARS